MQDDAPQPGLFSADFAINLIYHFSFSKNWHISQNWLFLLRRLKILQFKMPEK
jgi:hypothetical protein